MYILPQLLKKKKSHCIAKKKFRRGEKQICYCKLLKQNFFLICFTVSGLSYDVRDFSL